MSVVLSNVLIAYFLWWSHNEIGFISNSQSSQKSICLFSVCLFSCFHGCLLSRLFVEEVDICGWGKKREIQILFWYFRHHWTVDIPWRKYSSDNLITLIINLTINFNIMLKYPSKKACLDCCNFFDIHQFIDFHEFHRLCIKSILFWNVQGKVHL